jgi:hypothetical protein
VSFLNIISKFTLILRSVNMSVFAIAICHVISEITSVHIAFSVPECSLALGFVVTPMTFIMSAISPILYSVPVSDYLQWLLRFSLFLLFHTGIIWEIFITAIAHLLVFHAVTFCTKTVLQSSFWTRTITWCIRM